MAIETIEQRKTAFKICLAWDRNWPPGTPVLIMKDGDLIETVTFLPAFVDHSNEVPMINLEAFFGAQPLASVIPINPVKALFNAIKEV